MSARDFTVVSGSGGVRVAKVDDRDTSSTSATFKAGEPLKKGGAGTNFAILWATGDPEIGTDEVLGIASRESTETASLDGEVEYHSIVGGQSIIRGKATTAANVDTDAELLLLIGDYVTADLTSTTFTIDEDEGTDPNVHGLKILTGNTTRGELDVLVHLLATEGAPLTGQTMD